MQAIYNTDVRLFEKSGKFFAFGINNYSIVRLSRKGFDVFSSLQKYNSISSTIKELNSRYSLKEITSSYLQIQSLIENGYFLNESPVCNHSPNLNRLVVLVSGGCNMGCRYCFEKDIPVVNNQNKMSRQTADSLIKWFFKNLKGNKAYITLYGGEPLLNLAVVKYIILESYKLAAENQVTFIPYIITNGTLLNKNLALWLKAHNVKIQVSVDGNAETHNRFRTYKNSKSTHKRIIKNLQFLNESGVDYNLRAVVTRRNTKVSEILEDLRSYGTNRVSFDIVASESSDIHLSKNDWKSFLTDFSQYLNKPVENFDLLADEVQKTIKRISRKERLHFGCGAGINEFTVDPDGNIYECERLFGLPLGNIHDDFDISKVSIWFSEEHLSKRTVQFMLGKESLWRRMQASLTNYK
jgi:uncharacterized protein